MTHEVPITDDQQISFRLQEKYEQSLGDLQHQ
jgi:hypothetical protein